MKRDIKDADNPNVNNNNIPKETKSVSVNASDSHSTDSTDERDQTSNRDGEQQTQEIQVDQNTDSDDE